MGDQQLIENNGTQHIYAGSALDRLESVLGDRPEAKNLLLKALQEGDVAAFALESANEYVTGPIDLELPSSDLPWVKRASSAKRSSKLAVITKLWFDTTNNTNSDLQIDWVNSITWITRREPAVLLRTSKDPKEVWMRPPERFVMYGLVFELDGFERFIAACQLNLPTRNAPPSAELTQKKDAPPTYWDWDGKLADIIALAEAGRLAELIGPVTRRGAAAKLVKLMDERFTGPDDGPSISERKRRAAKLLRINSQALPGDEPSEPSEPSETNSA